MKFLIFRFFLLLILGEVLQSFLGISPATYIVILSLLFLFIVMFKHNDTFFLGGLISLCICLGGFWLSTSSFDMQAKSWDQWLNQNPAVEVEVEGRVHSNLVYYPERFGQQRLGFVLKTKGLGKFRVSAVNVQNALSYGDTLRVRGVLSPFAARRNPGGWDARAFYTNKGIFAQLQAKAVTFIPDAGKPVWTEVKNHLIESMKKDFGAYSALPLALFLGERSSLRRDFKNDLMQTGTMHLFAISGLHVALLAGLVYGLMMLFTRHLKVSCVSAIVFLILYCVVVGAQAPVFRATVMACVFLYGRMMWKKGHALNSLGFAGVITLFLNPGELFSVGFQLSYVAVTGLLVVMPHFYSVQDLRMSRSDAWWKVTLGYMVSLWIVSCVAWAVTLPVVIQYFHQVHILAPVFNLFLIPFIMILNAGLLLYSVLSMFPGELQSWLAEVLMPMAKSFETILNELNVLSSFHFKLQSWNILVWVFWVGGLGFVMRLKKVIRRSWQVVVLALVIANCLVLNPVLANTSSGLWRTTFFDVGQGDGIFMEFPGGGNLLVDTGSRGLGLRAIEPYLRSRGIGRIDAVVISHPQFDHCGALQDLIKEMDVGRVMTNGDTSSSQFYVNLLETMRQEDIPHEVLVGNSKVMGFEGMEIQVLHPNPNRMQGLDLNNQSIVLKVSRGDMDVLLTGDLEDEGIALLLPQLAGGNPIEILKVPHHGGKLKRHGLAFMHQLQAKAAVIQVGKGNRYGHPHPHTLEVLGQNVEKIYRTDDQGAIQLEVEKNGDFRIKKMV